MCWDGPEEAGPSPGAAGLLWAGLKTGAWNPWKCFNVVYSRFEKHLKWKFLKFDCHILSQCHMVWHWLFPVSDLVCIIMYNIVYCDFSKNRGNLFEYLCDCVSHHNYKVLKKVWKLTLKVFKKCGKFVMNRAHTGAWNFENAKIINAFKRCEKRSAWMLDNMWKIALNLIVLYQVKMMAGSVCLQQGVTHVMLVWFLILLVL